MASALHNIRSGLLARHQEFEVFRTPDYAYLPLLDYNPKWFQGSGYDPSAGDGRMIRDITRRGNPGPHYLNDIRAEELPKMAQLGTATVGDYLQLSALPTCDFWLTNPPFTKATQFVDRAKQHIRGPICVLQSLAWLGSRKRAPWWKTSGLAYVLNLPRRPKWEVEIGKSYSNVWDFAWYVFLPGHGGLPQMDWLI